MTERVIEEMMDHFRSNEQHWSRLIYLTQQIALTCNNTKDSGINQSALHNKLSSMEEIQEKMFDEIRDMKRRQEHAMQYLRQLYETNVQCLMKITALKEENERLKISQRTAVQNLQQRVSSALYVLDEQESHYLKHFSHSIALEEFWQHLLPRMPKSNSSPTVVDEMVYLIPKKHHSSNSSSGQTSYPTVKHELVTKWERDCAKVMKYLSVYCIRRLQQYAKPSDVISEDKSYANSNDELSEQFVQDLLKEMKRLGQKVDALRSSLMVYPSSDSEDSLDQVPKSSSNKNGKHRKPPHITSEVDEYRKCIEELKYQLSDCQANLSKEHELLTACKKQNTDLLRELEKTSFQAQRLECQNTSLKGLLAQKHNNSPMHQRTPPKLETILLSSPSFCGQFHHISHQNRQSVPTPPRPRHIPHFSPSNVSFLDVDNLWTPIKSREEIVRTDPKVSSSAASESLLGEDLSFVLGSSSFHHLHLQNINSKRQDPQYNDTHGHSTSISLNVSDHHPETVSFAISGSNVDESKTSSCDGSFADITLEDLANTAAIAESEDKNMGNGGLVASPYNPPGESGSIWETLQPHMLFNKINNSQPLHLLDMRQSHEDFSTKRIRGSYHCPTVDSAIEQASKLLFGDIQELPKAVKGMRYFTFLFPHNFSDDLKQNLLQNFHKLILSHHGSFARSDICLEVTAPTILYPSLDEKPNDDTTVVKKQQEDCTKELNFSNLVVDTTTPEPPCDNVPVSPPKCGPPTKEFSILDTSNKSESTFKVRVYILEDINNFLEKYKLCDILFETGTMNRTYCSQYYASEVVPDFLFLGDYRNATEEEQLKALQITHIIDATYEHLSEDKANKLGIKYFPVDIWDNEDADIKSFFPAANAFIAEAMAHNESQSANSDSDHVLQKNRVLVHCRAGWSRSPSIVLAFLMEYWNINLLATTRRVVRERPMVCPNVSFRKQLIAFEKERFETILASNPSLAVADSSSVHSEHLSLLCSDEDVMRLVIGEESCLWVGSVTVETDFDRIPIGAFKAKSAIFGCNADPVAPSDASSSATSKPKKLFLKRGEGKKALPTKPATKLKAVSKRYTPISDVDAITVNDATTATENSTVTAPSVASDASCNQQEESMPVDSATMDIVAEHPIM